MYEEEKKNEAAFDAAEAANDQAGMEAARARHTELIAQAREQGKNFCFILRLYSDMKERGNDMIDLNDIHDYQVPEVASILREFGIKQFSFSSTWSSAVSACWAFTQAGYVPSGMATINSQYKKFCSDERDQIPAFIFTVNE